MLLLGIDIGTSFVKASVVDAGTRQTIASASYPDTETPIIGRHPGWAEQSPEMWWDHTVQVIKKLISSKTIDGKDIRAIGVSYQMHGLVVVDKRQKPLRDAIIWCDSRSVDIGNRAEKILGQGICTTRLLNSPGNFTASKLAWVKENEPEIYGQIDKIMLPGDYIAMKLTGEITTTSSALSEGIFWDFRNDHISEDVINAFGFDYSLFPKVAGLFSSHGQILPEIARELGLNENIDVTYKAGDQLTSALSLNVLRPGEVAANAGTSGVLYSVTDQLQADRYSRINSFVHVNHSADARRVGVLLCINGAAIMYGWARKLLGDGLSYNEMNALAAGITTGSEGLFILPFGNGAERMLRNKLVGAHINGIDLNKHTKGHILRAILEGVAFSFRYGLDVMRENNLNPAVIRAGKSNLFLSEVFVRSFVNSTGIPLELYNNDGSAGAALGAGIGAGIYKTFDEALSGSKPLEKFEPADSIAYDGLYERWLGIVNECL